MKQVRKSILTAAALIALAGMATGCHSRTGAPGGAVDNQGYSGGTTSGSNGHRRRTHRRAAAPWGAVTARSR